jgi:hypothetical protein
VVRSTSVFLWMACWQITVFPAAFSSLVTPAKQKFQLSVASPKPIFPTFLTVSDAGSVRYNADPSKSVLNQLTQ